ncbi:hypothetical protein SAMN05660706_10519 [Desulfoscipio geothermicus DSM 3669]|uniref:Uncharacterized protein n=1 Tax=Desulfoscipio geothermicus DSM 3669 TaxID=1121426 RepID=A0A1I6D4A1_9FIRM|nr:hypothetical protein SAMN05660706_10519 [Desulfoscipio geothermicus DSM 3669]
MALAKGVPEPQEESRRTGRSVKPALLRGGPPLTVVNKGGTAGLNLPSLASRRGGGFSYLNAPPARHHQGMKIVQVGLFPAAFKISASTGLRFASGRIWRSCIMRRAGSYTWLFINSRFLFSRHAGGFCAIRPANSATSASPSPVTDAPIHHLRGATRLAPNILFQGRPSAIVLKTGGGRKGRE